MSVEVIETSLIAQLEQVFHPLVVATMPETQVTQIAGELERNRATREELQKRLSTLFYVETETDGGGEIHLACRMAPVPGRPGRPCGP